MKLPFLSVAICSLLLTGCFTGYKPGEISKAIGDKPGMTKLNLNSVYGRGDYLHINPLPSHSYTVAPDGTVRIQALADPDKKKPAK